MGNAEQPAGQPPRGVEGGEAAERLDEGFLREIFRKRAVFGHPRDEADDRPLIAADNLLEGGLGAPERLGHQTGFAYCLEIDRDVRSSLSILPAPDSSTDQPVRLTKAAGPALQRQPPLALTLSRQATVLSVPGRLYQICRFRPRLWQNAPDRTPKPGGGERRPGRAAAIRPLVRNILQVRKHEPKTFPDEYRRDGRRGGRSRHAEPQRDGPDWRRRLGRPGLEPRQRVLQPAERRGRGAVRRRRIPHRGQDASPRVQGQEEGDRVHRRAAAAREQGHRRDLDRLAEPLARADDHLGLPGRQGRLRREALLAQRLRIAADRRGRPQVQPDGAAGQPEPLVTGAARRRRTAAERGVRRDLHVARPLLQVARHDRQDAGLRRAARRRLRPVARTGAEARVHQESFPLQLALVLGHRQRRPGESGYPRSRHLALGPGRDASDEGQRDRRQVHVRRRSGDAEHDLGRVTSSTSTARRR